jgi:hypothetical protein
LIYFALGLIIGSDQNIGGMSSKPALAAARNCRDRAHDFFIGGWRQAPYRDPFLSTATFAISGIIADLALALLIDKERFGAAFRLLGRYSLEIYLVHTIATAGVRVALDKVANISAPVPHLVLGTLAGLYIPIGFALIFQRVDFRFGFTLPRGLRLNLISRP